MLQTVVSSCDTKTRESLSPNSLARRPIPRVGRNRHRIQPQVANNACFCTRAPTSAALRKPCAPTTLSPLAALWGFWHREAPRRAPSSRRSRGTPCQSRAPQSHRPPPARRAPAALASRPLGPCSAARGTCPRRRRRSARGRSRRGPPRRHRSTARRPPIRGRAVTHTRKSSQRRDAAEALNALTSHVAIHCNA